MVSKNNPFDQCLYDLFSIDPHRHISEAYNVLLLKYIPAIIKSYGTVATLVDGKKYHLIITDVIAHKSSISIENCFEYGLSYCCSLIGTLKLVCVEPDGQIRELKQVRTRICKIPMPTGPNIIDHTKNDTIPNVESGLFIINGKMRTIPATISLIFNEPFLFVKKDQYVLQIRSAHADKIYRSTSTIELSVDTNAKRANREGRISVKLPFQKTYIHIASLVLALGCEPHRFNKLIKSIAGKHYDYYIYRAMEISNLYGHDTQSTHDAILYISKLYGKDLKSTGENIIEKEVLPHLLSHTQGDDWRERKILYLANCVSQLTLFTYNRLLPTNRDSYRNLSVSSSTDLIGQLFRLLLITHIRTCGKLLRRYLMKSNGDIDLVKMFGESRLSARILSAVASGIWSPRRKGVSLALNNNNQNAIMSQLRRISSSLSTINGTHTEPRHVQPDQYGYICAASTPGGDQTGLVMELALTSSITIPVTDHVILNLLLEDILSQYLIPITDIILNDVFKFINSSGHITHVVDAKHISQVIQLISKSRRQGDIAPYVSMRFYNDNRRSLRIIYEGGLLTRPLIVVQPLREKMKTHSLDQLRTMSYIYMLFNGLLEWCTPAEESSLFTVGTTIKQMDNKKVTHIELTQASLFGITAACVPYATGQQGPRLSYYISQVKQFFSSNIHERYGVVSSAKLWCIHRNLVTTHTAVQMGDIDSGMFVPVVCALIPLQDVQEDAIIIKKSTIERGAFMGSTTRTYVSDAADPTTNLVERFEKADDVIGKKKSNYLNVADNGIPVVGTKISGMDIIIAKTRIHTKSQSQNVSKRDISISCKKDEHGTVIESKLTKLPTGIRATVTVETTRIPMVGDKFTTRYSQKGVVGAIWEDVDLPFAMMSGIIPDLVVSPLSMTSRMTMAALIEFLTGKVVAITGDLTLGIDDQNFDISMTQKCTELGNILKKYGFSQTGKEMYIDGRTGKPLQAQIMTGVVSYARLNHLAAKKAHIRTTGPMDPLTRQPRDGRKYGGGLRCGEMETSALAAHGAATVLQERIRDFSDLFIIYVCSSCHTITDTCEEIGFYYCEHCASNEKIQKVAIPFTLLVLSKELEASGIVMQFEVEHNPVTNMLTCQDNISGW